MKRSRWGKKKESNEHHGEECLSTMRCVTRGGVARSATVYADQLFEQNFTINSQNKSSMAENFGTTSRTMITSKLRSDSQLLKHSCIYIPQFLTEDSYMCDEAKNIERRKTHGGPNITAPPPEGNDLKTTKGETMSSSEDSGTIQLARKTASAGGKTASKSSGSMKKAGEKVMLPDVSQSNVGGFASFAHLYTDLSAHFLNSVYRRSKHPAVLEAHIFRQSPVYEWVRRKVMQRFPTLEIGYSIVNLYRNGADCTEMHRDNFQGGGNRQFEEGEPENSKKRKIDKPHNVTIGVSLGGTRKLVFKHLQSEAEFSFDQFHGDLFAFTTPVNSVFQHGILTEAGAKDPRISIIFWGTVADEKLV